MLGTILIVLLILLLIGALPTWPYSRGWGYSPGGGLGLILIIVIVLVLVMGSKQARPEVAGLTINSAKRCSCVKALDCFAASALPGTTQAAPWLAQRAKAGCSSR
jgi:hypothetical protein